MIRTTIRLDEDTFKTARKKAIDERVSFAELVNKALQQYLEKTSDEEPKQVSFKVYNMGNITGSLSRSELYEDR